MEKKQWWAEIPEDSDDDLVSFWAICKIKNSYEGHIKKIVFNCPRNSKTHETLLALQPSTSTPFASLKE